MKIHISAETKLLLDALGGFRTEHRGLIELKFKGLVDTYWLLGKKQEKSNNFKHIFPIDKTVTILDYWRFEKLKKYTVGNLHCFSDSGYKIP